VEHQLAKLNVHLDFLAGPMNGGPTIATATVSGQADGESHQISLNVLETGMVSFNFDDDRTLKEFALMHADAETYRQLLVDLACRLV
jgi:hypothetical protein